MPVPCRRSAPRPASPVGPGAPPGGARLGGRTGGGDAPSVRKPSLAIREGALGYRSPQPLPLLCACSVASDAGLDSRRDVFGQSAALCLPTAACASPLRDGGGSRRAGPASGAGCVARVRVRACARPGGWGGPPPPPPHATHPVCVRVCRASGRLAVWAAARSRAESPPAVARRARVGRASSRLGAPPRVVTPGWTGRMDGRADGRTEVRTGPPRRGSRVPGPGRCGARFAGRPAKGAEAGRRPGRRGTALVLVAVGSRARLPGGPARAFVGAPFPGPALPHALSRPSPAVRLLPVAADPPPPAPPACPRPPTARSRARRACRAPNSALRGPKPASPLLGVLPPPLAAVARGGRPRAKCSRSSEEGEEGGARGVLGRGVVARVRESVLGRTGRVNGGGWGPRAPRGCLGPAVGGRAGVLGCRGTALALEASGGGTPRAPLGARPRPPGCLLRLPESPSRWPAVLSSTAPARRSPAPGWPLAAGASPVRGLSRKSAPVRRPSCRPGAALPGAPGASRARCGLPARVRRSPPPPGGGVVW